MICRFPGPVSIFMSLNKNARYLELSFVLSFLITSRNVKDSTECRCLLERNVVTNV